MAQPVTLHIVRDDGEEFFIDNERWMIPNDGLEGWAELEHSVSSQESATYDGGIITNQRVGITDRSVTAELRDWRDNAAGRAEAISFFRPKHSYAAHLTYQGRTRWAQGVQYAFKCDAGNIYQPCSISWTILCQMPYLQSESDFGRDIAAIEPKFGFPFTSAIDRVGSDSKLAHQQGFYTGKYTFGDTVVIDNDGDADAWPRVSIKASGTVVNPRIRVANQGSEGFVMVNVTMTDGDELTLDFESRPPKVLLNGQNATWAVDRDSSFSAMRFEPGVSELSYSADEGDNLMSVSLYYYKRYAGI